MKTQEMSDFYKRKLLELGWAGELSPAELSYIRVEPRQLSSLRRCWGSVPRQEDSQTDVSEMSLEIVRKALASKF